MNSRIEFKAEIPTAIDSHSGGRELQQGINIAVNRLGVTKSNDSEAPRARSIKVGIPT
jgi:hypothetical protein